MSDVSPISEPPPWRESESSLVLGLAAGLELDLITPFFNSLSRSGFAGIVGLVVANYHQADVDRLRDMVDVLWLVDDEYGTSVPSSVVESLRFIRGKRAVRRTYPLAFRCYSSICRESSCSRRWRNLEFCLEGLQSLRYQHYTDVVNSLPHVDYVLLSDVRDVLFQASPFAEPVRSLELFAEDASRQLGSDAFNRRWLRDLYGDEVVRQFASAVVSCSGTVIGPRSDILRYLAEMRADISARRQPMGNHDQGVHNFLLRSGRLAPAEVVANGTGRVLTMGAMGTISRSNSGQILNSDGSVPAILHQYDRHPELARSLLDLLARSAPPIHPDGTLNSSG